MSPAVSRLIFASKIVIILSPGIRMYMFDEKLFSVFNNDCLKVADPQTLDLPLVESPVL